MVQNPIIFPFFQPCLPNGIPQMLQSFDKKVEFTAFLQGHILDAPTQSY